jgi:disulfide bond formation protein DsbB
MLKLASPLQRYSPYGIGGLVLVLAVAVILAALAFEHIGGYTACPLCLQQRYAYYAGIPALLAALGTYQAGAEWSFWDPPASCAAPSELPSFDLKRESFDRIPASCGVASWRFLGLSFAGWNVVASGLLAAGAVAAAVDALAGRPGR